MAGLLLFVASVSAERFGAGGSSRPEKVESIESIREIQGSKGTKHKNRAGLLCGAGVGTLLPSKETKKPRLLRRFAMFLLTSSTFFVLRIFTGGFGPSVFSSMSAWIREA